MTDVTDRESRNGSVSITSALVNTSTSDREIIKDISLGGRPNDSSAQSAQSTHLPPTVSSEFEQAHKVHDAAVPNDSSNILQGIRAGIDSISDFLLRPFREDKTIAIIYNLACTVSTTATTLLTYFYSDETRAFLGLSASLADNARFAAIVNVFCYSAFCACYYPGMIWLKFKELGIGQKAINRGHVADVAAQCGVDFGVHFFLVDVPCHLIGGIIQTGLTTMGVYIGYFSLTGLDAITTFVSQVLADAIFTPLEAPIWRKSGTVVETTRKLVSYSFSIVGISVHDDRRRSPKAPLVIEPINRDDLKDLKITGNA